MAMHTTRLLAAIKQGSKVVTTASGYEGCEVEYSPQRKGDHKPWRVKGLTGIDRVPAASCEIQDQSSRYDAETIQALADLRSAVVLNRGVVLGAGMTDELAKAFHLLDRAGVFAPLDE